MSHFKKEHNVYTLDKFVSRP